MTTAALTQRQKYVKDNIFLIKRVKNSFSGPATTNSTSPGNQNEQSRAACFSPMLISTVQVCSTLTTGNGRALLSTIKMMLQSITT